METAAIEYRKRVLATILSEMAQRRAPTPGELATFPVLRDGPVAEAVADLVRIGAVVTDARGTLLAAYPLSSVPTSHSVEFGSEALWANCAIDALAVPAMVGRRGTVRSRCAHCGAAITVDVDGANVFDASPGGIVVVYGRLADRHDRSSLEASCPFINFFCSLDHAHAWERPNSWQGKIMPLNEALAFAVDRFRPIIEIYSSYRRSCRTNLIAP